MKAEWLADLKPCDLPEPYAGLAEKIGIEVAVILAEEFGGMGLYFPKIDSTLRKMRNARMKAEFTGFNHKALAKKYDLTDRHVRNIVEGPDDKQESMFGEQSQ